MVSKWEKAVIKEYIDNIYSINCATFLEVNDKRKVRKLLNRNFNDNITYLRKSDLILLPYKNAKTFYNLYGDLINEYVNDSFKPVCGDYLWSIVESQRLKGFLRTMIVRNNIKWVTFSGRSLMYFVDTLLNKAGIETKISLKHMLVKIVSQPYDIITGIEKYEYRPEDLSNFGWMLKLSKVSDDSPIKYRKIKYSNGVVIVFDVYGDDFREIEKYDNYILTGENYKRIAKKGLTGFRWIIKGDATLKRITKKKFLYSPLDLGTVTSTGGASY